MLFGLCNGPSTLERLMELVLAGYQWETCLIYIDGIIVFGKVLYESISSIQKIFQLAYTEFTAVRSFLGLAFQSRFHPHFQATSQINGNNDIQRHEECPYCKQSPWKKPCLLKHLEVWFFTPWI